MADEYASYDVPQLWEMVQSAHQQLPPTREQISAWRRAHTMLDQHATALRACRSQLAALWPPEENAASAAYLAELDRLLHAAEQTAKAAQTNATHIGYLADATEQAYAEMEPIYQEYLRNERRLADYRGQLDSGLTSPPAEVGRQAELHRQARAVLAELGQAAHDGGERLQLPPEYLPPVQPGSDHLDSVHGINPAAGAAPRPPAIPRPPSFRPDFGQGFLNGSFGSDASYDPSGEESAEGLTSIGPGLSSVGPLSMPPGPTTPGPSIASAPPPSVSPPAPVVSLPPVAGGPPTGQPPVPGRIGGPLPPGGVIGNQGNRAGGGRPGIAGGPAGGRTVPRATPVGGVIGQPDQHAAARPSGAAGGQGRGRLDGDEPQQRRREPDTIWTVREGVAPAIEPNLDTGPVEPGSNVIGVDR